MIKNIIDTRLEELGKKREKAFMAHVYCGDPSIEFSKNLIQTLVEGGVDILELGIPFSDPIADGPVFQGACKRALENGTTPDDVFRLIKEIRGQNMHIPIVLTTYYNIIYQYGIIDFVKKIIICGIQGLIVPDLSFEESDDLYQECVKNNVHLIYLVAPTTNQTRLNKILKAAKGFVYIVSLKGVTGSIISANDDIKGIIKNIRKLSKIPLLIGFGISKPEHIIAYQSQDINGFIIGSEICRIYQNDINDKDRYIKIREFVKQLKNQMIS